MEFVVLVWKIGHFQLLSRETKSFCTTADLVHATPEDKRIQSAFKQGGSACSVPWKVCCTKQLWVKLTQASKLQILAEPTVNINGILEQDNKSKRHGYLKASQG